MDRFMGFNFADESQYICTNCGYEGEPVSYTPGSFLIELALWICFIVPGLIYSIWRISARKKVCPECKSPHMIPRQRQLI